MFESVLIINKAKTVSIKYLDFDWALWLKKGIIRCETAKVRKIKKRLMMTGAMRGNKSNVIPKSSTP